MKDKKTLRKIVDMAMAIVLLCLMAYQITGEFLHEWLGIIMTILVIIHQILNLKCYKTIFRGKYSIYRFVNVALNIFLLLSFMLTAICGMSMSNHAVPFLYGILTISFARIMHLAFSHYSFVLMGLHVGFHMPMILGKLNKKTKGIIDIIILIFGSIGLYLFIKNGIHEYILFRVAFAYYDYDKSALLVFIENMLMLLTFVYIGWKLSISLMKNNH